MKKLIVCLLLVTNIMAIHAQFPSLGTGKLAGQEMTCKALENTLYLVNVNYRLKDKENGKFYGRDGKADFGHGYGLGVKTEEGILMLSSQLMPWNRDKDYLEVANKYEAVPSSIEFCGVSDKEYLPANKPVSIDGTYQIIDPQSKGGLSIVPDSGEVNGWCVWLTVPTGSKEVAPEQIECRANTRPIEVSDSTLSVDAGNIPSGCDVIGGVYVYPEYIDGGIIKFNLLGLLDQTFDKWNVILPFQNFKSEDVKQQPQVEEEKKEVNITPIEPEEEAVKDQEKDKGKKKKKEKKK